MLPWERSPQPPRDDGEVYYCTQNAGAGLRYNKERKRYEPERFDYGRFTFKLLEDKQRAIQSMNGKDHHFACALAPGGYFVACVSGYARTFNFNPKSRAFTYSFAWGNLATGTDDIFVANGTCTAF